MSALVSVTICTAERQIHRFDTLEAAAGFLVTRPSPQALLRNSRGSMAPSILACLAKTSPADAGHVADALDTSIDSVNPVLRRLVTAGHIEIVDVKDRGRRIYRITSAGREAIKK